MMGQGMMQGSMMSQCKMHGQMGQKMMGMSDPVIKALHSAGCPGFVLKSTDKLELSEKQVSDLKVLKSEFQKFSIRKNADIKIAKLELNGLLDSANPDFGKIKNKVEQIGALEQGLRFEFLSTVQKSRAILTAEQLNKLTGLSKNCCMGMMSQSMMK